jgi:hypothetical protein
MTMSYAPEVVDDVRTLEWSRPASPNVLVAPPETAALPTPTPTPSPWPSASPMSLAPLAPLPSRAPTVAVRARPRPTRERRSFMPLVVFAATFVIGFSLGQDDAVHADVTTQLRAAAGQVAALLVRL